ncbi:hypothetical protein A5761_01775 [Mycolicibacterium setense]|nr:hypothetical protein A5761_01775 [Mycolicibacterium setense]
MSRSIEALEEIDVVRSSMTGVDVFDENALIVLIVLDSFDALAEYRSQPAYQSMAQYIQPLGLYPDKMVQFNIEMPQGAPSPGSKQLLHGCQIDASTIDAAARTVIIDQMRELGRQDFVSAATAGIDLLAGDAISQVMFFDSAEGIHEYRQHPLFSELASSIGRGDLPSTSFSLELGDHPW